MLLNYSHHCCLFYGQRVFICENGYFFPVLIECGLPVLSYIKDWLSRCSYQPSSSHSSLLAMDFSQLSREGLLPESPLLVLPCISLWIQCLYIPFLVDLLSSNCPLSWEPEKGAGEAETERETLREGRMKEIRKEGRKGKENEVCRNHSWCLWPTKAEVLLIMILRFVK